MVRRRVRGPVLAADLVHGDGGGRGHVERADRAELGQVDQVVAAGEGGLGQAPVLVAHGQAHVRRAGPARAAARRPRPARPRRAGSPAASTSATACSTVLAHGPGDEALRAQRGLLGLGVVGRRRRADEPQVVDPVGRRRAQDRPDVVGRLHAVEQQRQPPLGAASPLAVEALELGAGERGHRQPASIRGAGDAEEAVAGPGPEPGRSAIPARPASGPASRRRGASAPPDRRDPRGSAGRAR